MRIEKNESPLISVIICIFNRADLINRALLSLINQTFKNFEVIIVDDGSTDNVEEIIFPYLKKYNNFKYIRHSNRNLSLSRNTGILLAQGKYITFLDSDDEYKNNHLEKMFNYMEENPSCDFIYSVPEIIVDSEEDFWVPDARDLSKLINLNECAIGPTFFGKKEVFIGLNGYRDIPYAEDFDLYERLVSSNNYQQCKLYEETYVYYRNGNNSIASDLKKSLKLFKNK